MCWVGLLVVGLALLASPALAQAPPPDPARLDYTRAPDVDACPEEFYFRAFVARGFGGQDPFTPLAPRRITVALRRKSGKFVAKLDVWDQAGGHLGENDPLVDSDCTKVVERAGDIVVSWLVPLIGPRRTPAQEPPRPEPAPVVPQPPQPPPVQPAPMKPLAESVGPAYVDVPKPGVFEGQAGFVRALLFGVAASGLATGITFEAVAINRGVAARDGLAMIEQKAGASPCVRSAPGFAGPCQQVVELRQQHDTCTDLAIGSFVAAGLTAATASIWILRTPLAPSVQVTPSAPKTLAGLMLQGSW